LAFEAFIRAALHFCGCCRIVFLHSIVGWSPGTLLGEDLWSAGDKGRMSQPQ